MLYWLNLFNPAFFNVVQLSYIKTMLQLHLYSIMQGKHMYIEDVLGTTYSSGIFHGPASLRFRIREVQPVLCFTSCEFSNCMICAGKTH